jgi:hypothetical protein
MELVRIKLTARIREQATGRRQESGVGDKGTCALGVSLDNSLFLSY